MKLCYFLQTICEVPLEYEFSLYSYGPFDSDLLSDLQTAEAMSVLTSEVQHYSGGYKYDIRLSEKSEQAKELGKDFLKLYDAKIKWATEKFGAFTASDLELLSTLVFVYQEGFKEQASLEKAVKSVKPHFSDSHISKQAAWLSQQGLLKFK